MKAVELFDAINITKVCGDMNIEISDVCYDSRKAKPSCAFVCIVGYETDGHKYIASAIEKGAALIVVQNGSDIPKLPQNITVVYADNTRITLAQLGAAFYGHPEEKLQIIGVTGTNGKTTVTSLVKSVLEFHGKKTGLIGTNANMIGDVVLPTERTTPESLELFALFADMVKAGVEYVIMEVSSHSLDLFRVYGIRFCVGAFTNLTQDHLDFHKTMENYANAKKKLFSVSDAGVVNTDDACGKEIYEEKACPMTGFSVGGSAELSATNIRVSSQGVLFDLAINGEQHKVRLCIPGKFSVYNALTALGIVACAGIPMKSAVEALMFAKGVMGRCESVYTNTDYAVIIDYAHTPDGLSNIISTVREFTEGRVITLFGCGGDRDRTKRPEMGKIAAKLSDYLIVTSDNPRTEQPASIIEDIMEGVKTENCPYTVIENRREAIAFSLSFAQKGDSIILAGKGHETYQILGKEKTHFDEREVVREALLSLKKSEEEDK